MSGKRLVEISSFLPRCLSPPGVVRTIGLSTTSSLPRLRATTAQRFRHNSTSTQTTAEKPVPTGTLSSIKTLYGQEEERENGDDEVRFTWSEKQPSYITEAAENEETASHAFIVRQKKSFDSRRGLDLHSIIIQSPWLKKALGTILSGYPGVTCELDRLEFHAPFEPFIHRWGNILKFNEALPSALLGSGEEAIYFSEDDILKTKAHMKLLLEFLHSELKETTDAVVDFQDHGVCTYEHLWTIFQPGGVVLSSHSETLSGYEFVSGEYLCTDDGPAYQLKLECIAWDGLRFGRHKSDFYLYEFKGMKDITKLKAYPLAFHPEKEQVRHRLVDRGKKAEELAGYCYKAYDGMAITWDEGHRQQRTTASGRIIIDAQSFNRFTYLPGIRTESLKETDKVITDEQKPINETGDSPSEPGHPLNSPPESRVRLSEQLHLISSPLVRGYSLKAKKWLAFFVDHITPIKWNASAFSSLVLPPSEKELIMSMAETQSSGSSQFDDVIAGKGRGIIMLLSGPPGIGKTLTAESIAEQMRIPLYTLSASDLGQDPSDIEDKLNNVVAMVMKWRAVLLLDEADIFLETRGSFDLERNKVVSVFLRTLEYYEGIFVLTTNRSGNIDPAFQSRIHVAIEYPALAAPARRKVWDNILAQQELLGVRHELTKGDLEELSRLELNGRQIKNVLKTAQLLLEKRGGMLRREIVDTILDIGKGGKRIVMGLGS